MAEFIDGEAISNDQRVELYEGGEVWVIQTTMVAEHAKPAQEIKLDAAAAMKLLDFLQLHQDRLNRHARAGRRDIEVKDAEEQAHQDWANDE